MTVVAVVIPAWNADAFLGDSIESVRAQTFPGWRLIIIDDGSTDWTRPLAERYAAMDERITVQSQENAGLSAARNAGFAALPAEAEYCLFLDADDLLEPEALELLLAAADRERLVGAHGLPREIEIGRAHV